MENKLVIHCIGLQGLTVTVFGADHSMPIDTDVLRVTTLLGSTDYTVPQLPATYDLTDLNGNLTISDSSGKALYRWRLHATAQPPVAEHQQPESQPCYHSQRHKPSTFLSAPPIYCAAEIPPSASSGKALNRHTDPQSVISDVDARPEDADGPRILHARIVRKVAHIESTLPPTSTESSGDLSSSSPQLRKVNRQAQRILNGAFNVSSGDGSPSLELDTPSAKRRRCGTSGDGGLDPSESNIPSKRRSKRAENLSLRRLVDRLLRENPEDSKPFAEPVNAVAEGIPDYHTVIKRAMDLRTLKANVGKEVYSTVKDFEADFYLMIQNSISYNGPTHEISERGLRLLTAFDALMVSLRGRR